MEVKTTAKVGEEDVPVTIFIDLPDHRSSHTTLILFMLSLILNIALIIYGGC